MTEIACEPLWVCVRRDARSSTEFLDFHTVAESENVARELGENVEGGLRAPLAPIVRCIPIQVVGMAGHILPEQV